MPDPGITRTTHYPHGRVVQLGQAEAHPAADCSDRGLRAAVTVRRVLVNGEPCVLAWLRTRNPLGLMAMHGPGRPDHRRRLGGGPGTVEGDGPA